MSPEHYALIYTPTAARQIGKLPPLIQRRVLAALEELRADPRRPGVKAVKGPDGGLRLRVGDYRVLYDVDDRAGRVFVRKVGHRREVYDR
ncbi:MAG: type II toxin-antitoxin system RelE family toxin [Egibacteraceae bacterium]